MQSSIFGSIPGLQKSWIRKRFGLGCSTRLWTFKGPGYLLLQGHGQRIGLGLPIPSAHLHRQAGCRPARCPAWPPRTARGHWSCSGTPPAVAGCLLRRWQSTVQEQEGQEPDNARCRVDRRERRGVSKLSDRKDQEGCYAFLHLTRRACKVCSLTRTLPLSGSLEPV